MGIVHRHRGDLDQALGYLEQQLQMARGMDDRPVQSYTSHEIGIVHERLGDDRRALTWYLDALRMACESEDLSIAAPIINSLGKIYRHAGDCRRAIQCHTASARIAGDRCERLYLGLALGALAGTYAAHRCDGEAELLFERILASTLPQPYERCECLQQYAGLLFRQGRYDDAHRMNDEALRLAREVARADVQNRAEVLAIRLQLALSRIDLGSGIAALEQLLPARPGSAEHAPIQYEIWRLDGTREAARRSAADAYRALYQDCPRSEYRRRYRELTAQDLPDPPPLPELPEIVTRFTLDSNEFLGRLDRMLRATLL
jgi:tetratricopeptide (TPR) repeat protein